VEVWDLQDTSGQVLGGVKIFFSYFALFSYLIPLSLVVTLEMVRFSQATFIEWDQKLKKGKKKCVAKTSNLTDELALIDYIFSDKTGTLTENEMQFVMASIRGKIYDDSKGEGALAKEMKQSPLVLEYLYLLALCHSVVTEEKKGEIIYKAASPDEEALCSGAASNDVSAWRTKRRK